MAQILSPEEVTRRRNSKSEIQETEEIKAVSYAGSVEIQYESMGRFSTPEILHFKDYTNNDINNLTLSNDDDLLDTLLTILNANKMDEKDFNIEDMTAEDLMETLIAIKIQFESPFQEIRWICPCQADKEDSDRIVNDFSFDLRTATYISIEQVDEILKEELSSLFMDLSEDEFKQFLIKKYKDNPLDDIDSYTREMEIAKIKVNDLIYVMSGDDIYGFRYPRIKDILKAKKYSDKIYLPKIKSVQNRKEANVPLFELKMKKEKEIKSLKEEQAKLIILYAESMMLVSKNEVELTDYEKFVEYKEVMPRNISNYIHDVFDKIQFGLQHEMELVCPICGETEKRSLQQVLDPRELLPNRNGRKSTPISTSRESGQHSRAIIYFGI